MSDTLERLRDYLLREIETARADLKSSAKLPDGYAHGATNGRLEALQDVLAFLDRHR